MKNKNYIVFIEPVDENMAWVFVGQDGMVSQETSLNHTWDHIPTENEIRHILEISHMEVDCNYYVTEGVVDKNKTINLRVIEENEILYSKTLEEEKEDD